MSICQQVSNNLFNEVFMSICSAASRQQHVQRRVHVNLFFSFVTANTQKHVQRRPYKLVAQIFLVVYNRLHVEKVRRGVHVYLLPN